MLIIGCGKVGAHIAKQCSRPKENIFAWVRRADAANSLQAFTTPILSDIGQPDWSFPKIHNQAQWVYTIPPSVYSKHDVEHDEHLAKFLAHIPKQAIPARCLYISTSGVYGNHNGAWVDETTPPHPISLRAKRRWDAEQQWQNWCDENGVDLIIARAPGIIYSQEQILERARSGQPLIHPDEAPYTNLVNADYLAKSCLFLLSKAPAGVYNISDRAPVTSTSYILDACEKAGLPAPELVSMVEAEKLFNPIRMSFLKESRRINCDKLYGLMGKPYC